MKYEGTIGGIATVLVLGVGILIRFRPEVQLVGTAVVASVIVFLFVVPYVPAVGLGYPSQSLIGVVVASIGGYGLLTADGTSTLTWLLVGGGVAMLLGDQYRKIRRENTQK